MMRLLATCVLLVSTVSSTPASDDRIVFPSEHSRLFVRQANSSLLTPPTTQPTDLLVYEGGIPLDEIHKLNEIDSIEEFLRLYGSDVNNTEVADLVSRINGFDDVARSNVESPKPAKCEPEMTTVPLQNATNALMLVFPSCTRVLRCGGCCNSDLLSCQPKQKRLRNFQVYITEYTNGRLVPHGRKEVVTIEEHLKCACACRVKEEHCNSFQEYKSKDCRCQCINYEDRQKCETDNITKIWDYEQCLCKCRDVTECSTGLYFDEQTCSCKPEPVLISRYGTDPHDEFRRVRRPSHNRYGYTTSQRLVTSNRSD